MPASGARKKHGRKQSAVNTDVQPVRPPLWMPAILSIYAVPDDDPARPAPKVASESTIKPCFRLRGFPSSSRRLAACATPMNVEIESKRSVKSMPVIAGSSESLSAPKMSNFKNTVRKSGDYRHTLHTSELQSHSFISYVVFCFN